MKMQSRPMKALGVATVAAFLILAACGSESNSTLAEVEAGTDAVSSTAVSSTTEAPPEPVAEIDEDAILIETEVDFASGGGTFVVDEGASVLGCDFGSVVELETPEHITTTFTCEDGDREGSFTFGWTIEEGSEGPGDVNGPWSVIGATNEFAGLTGDGFMSAVIEGETGFASFPGAVEFGSAATGEADPAIVADLSAFVVAFYTGDADTAWNTYSKRCQAAVSEEVVRDVVARLTLVVPGGTVSDISTVVEGDRAAVTYYVLDNEGTLAAPYFAQPWSFADGKWHWDAC